MTSELLWKCQHFRQSGTSIHDSHDDMTIKSDTWQHLQFLQCFAYFSFLYICHFIQLWKEWGLEEDCFWWLVKVQQRKCQLNANIQVFIETFTLLIILWLSHCLPSNIPMTIRICSCPANSVPTLDGHDYWLRLKNWELSFENWDHSEWWLEDPWYSISTICGNEWRWNWTKRWKLFIEHEGEIILQPMWKWMKMDVVHTENKSKL